MKIFASLLAATILTVITMMCVTQVRAGTVVMCDDPGNIRSLAYGFAEEIAVNATFSKQEYVVARARLVLEKEAQDTSGCMTLNEEADTVDYVDIIGKARGCEYVIGNYCAAVFLVTYTTIHGNTAAGFVLTPEDVELLALRILDTESTLHGLVMMTLQRDAVDDVSWFDFAIDILADRVRFFTHKQCSIVLVEQIQFCISYLDNDCYCPVGP